MNSIYDFAEKAISCYNDIKRSTITDSMDVIVVKHSDGSLHSSPFYVRFGNFGALKPKEKLVTIEVNGVLIKDFVMKLDEFGEAFFSEESLDESLLKSNKSSLTSLVSVFQPTNIEQISAKTDTNDKIGDFLRASNNLKDYFTNSNLTQPLVENVDSHKPKFYIDISSSSIDEPLQDCKNKASNDLTDKECNLSKDSNSNSRKVLFSIESGSVNLFDENCKQEKENINKNINLTTDKLLKLNLISGPNEIKYTLVNSPSGAKTTKSFIYLWSSSDKIIVSDIDGTITKSDFRGHVMSFIGRDWYHEGVVDLFNLISNNGFKIIYLSARPICTSELTRNLIQSIIQNDSLMPKGAVLVNPVDFLIAFQAELIHKNPDEFKISCLNNIKSLFVEDALENNNPFYAGFGNKETDVKTYKCIGIDDSLIFNISQMGKVSTESDEISELTYKVLTNELDKYFLRND